MPANRSPILHSQEIVKRRKPPACDSCKARRVLCHPTTDGTPCPRCLEKGTKCTTTPVARGRPPKPNLGMIPAVIPSPKSVASTAASHSASEEPENHPSDSASNSSSLPSRGSPRYLELSPELVHHLFECFTHLPQFNHPMLRGDVLRDALSSNSWQIHLLPPQLKVLAHCICALSASISFDHAIIGPGPKPSSLGDRSVFTRCADLREYGVRRKPMYRALCAEALRLASEVGVLLEPSEDNAVSCFMLQFLENGRRDLVLLLCNTYITSVSSPDLFHVTRLARDLYEKITGDFARRHPLDEGSITEFISSLDHLHSIRSLIFDREDENYPGDSLFNPSAQRRDVHLNLRSCAYIMTFSRATLVLGLHRELVRRAAISSSSSPAIGLAAADHWAAERLVLLRRQVSEMADLALGEIARGLRTMPSLPHIAHLHRDNVVAWAEFCLDEADAAGSVSPERAAIIETISEALKLVGYSWLLPPGLVERLDAYVDTHRPSGSLPPVFSEDSMFLDMFPAPLDNNWVSMFTVPPGNEAFSAQGRYL
ncbi:Zn(2)-C6 fungal-type transcriptional factor [Mycena venus]|uniref:Zn(2)-C6 fungal-type transcriptional factor n=1 Tax=Mycena venus TaxID=2733690 RepID=A0A8H6XLL7_9AGAR|nr:Zn(2)-C6 fungal-type transcriptional factor [Mycena venus]